MPFRKMQFRSVGRMLAGSLLLFPVSASQAPQVQSTPAPTSPSPAAPRAEAAVLARGRALTQLFYAVKVEAVWAAFTPELQATWGSLADFRSYREMGVREYGAESRVLGERVIEQGGVRYYVRDAVFAQHPGEVWSVVFGFDAAGRVRTFTIALAGGAPQEDGDPLRT